MLACRTRYDRWLERCRQGNVKSRNKKKHFFYKFYIFSKTKISLRPRTRRGRASEIWHPSLLLASRHHIRISAQCVQRDGERARGA